MQYKEVAGGICAPKGFAAAGVHCGIRTNHSEKYDLALIKADVRCAAAGVYTTNKVCGAPIKVDRAHLTDGYAQAIVVNSGNANTCAANGVALAEECCELVGRELGIDPQDVLPASTGVIGMQLPMEKMTEGVRMLAKAIKPGEEAGTDAAKAIMTTDTRNKQVAVKVTIGGKEVTIGGMCKGSGMIHPNMGTMLCFITTDCAIDPSLLRSALREVVSKTFNRISVDGDTSTNDTCIVMANGMAGNELLDWKSEEYHAFYDALYEVALTLAKKMAADGEGASRLISCTVKHSRAEEYAERLAKAVIASSLVKAAMYGADANWGRVLCAMGYSKAPFRPEFVNIGFSSAAGSITVCENGEAVDFDEDAAKKILLEKEVSIDVDIQEGEEEATAYGCDLTYDYVRINGDYRT